MSKLTKAGLAKKAFDEARKPQNQRRIKSAVSRLRGRHGGGTGTATGTGGATPPR